MARRPLTSLLAVTAAVLLGLAPLAVPAPAAAAARVTVANAAGDAIADPTYATTVTVSGRGFQSMRGGFGGIYVFFGTVKGTWRPSQGGQTGSDYLYVPDSEGTDNQGFQRFVAFPGSDTAASANGGTLRADGTWSTRLVIPGATFRALDRDGRATTVDCRKVTCGVLTIGAHGVANGRNESFTPVRFRSLSGASAAPSPSATGSPSAVVAPRASATPSAVGAPSAPSSPTTPAPAAPAPTGRTAVVTVDRATAVAGRVLTFTAAGYRPGEQVVASLDDGIAAVGPLAAGADGEIAGVLRLPADLAGGTHVLKVSGAASGQAPSVGFAVTPAATPVATAGASADRAPYVFLALALLVLAGAAGVAVLRRRRSGRRRVRAATGATGATGAAGGASHAL